MTKKIGLAYPVFKRDFEQLFENIETINDYKKTGFYDLIVFPGGEDISRAFYTKEKRFSFRDGIEKTILEEAINKQKQILGVCRGHQLICAHIYKTKLISDLLSIGIIHKNIHPLMDIKPNSIISKFFTFVNSLHHQGISVRELPNELITSSYFGVVESTESQDKKILTVQWHPEFLFSDVCKPFAEFIKEY